jgi:hypothetical protein
MAFQRRRDNAPMSAEPTTARLGRAPRAAGWLLKIAVANAGAAVYGAVMVGVLFAAEDARHEGYPATIEAALIVLALYWLTSLYTHTLGARLRNREPLNAKLLWQGCVYELPIVEGALVPILALLLTWAAGYAVGTGVSAALWTTVVVIVVLEVAAGWRSRRDPRSLLLQAGAGAVMGLALIGLKLVLH